MSPGLDFALSTSRTHDKDSQVCQVSHNQLVVRSPPESLCAGEELEPLNVCHGCRQSERAQNASLLGQHGLHAAFHSPFHMLEKVSGIENSI